MPPRHCRTRQRCLPRPSRSARRVGGARGRRQHRDRLAHAPLAAARLHGRGARPGGRAVSRAPSRRARRSCGCCGSLAPLLRRLFGLSAPLTASDPLALAPFLLRASGGHRALPGALSRSPSAVLVPAAAGYLLGVPKGLSRPRRCVRAVRLRLAMGCFVLGYSETARSSSSRCSGC